MAQTSLIVGIGNPLQGADGFGPAVVAALRASTALPPGARVVDAHTDLLAYIDQFATVDHVVLVDAFLGSGNGEVAVLDESTFARWTVDSPSSHQISALLAVALFRRLYPQATARITLVGLNVSGVSAGAEVASDSIATAVAIVTRMVGTPSAT